MCPFSNKCLRSLFLTLCFLVTIRVSTANVDLGRLKHLQELEAKWGADYNYGGIATFAHLRHLECLVDKNQKFDVAILGVPADYSESWRGGGRFGPQALRQASSRQSSFRGFNHRASLNPYRSWARVVDCGDTAIPPLSYQGALRQDDDAFWELSHRQAATDKKVRKPRLISIGGDRISTLSALRALVDIYHQRIAIVSFGAIHDILGYEECINFNSSIHVGYHAMHKAGETWAMTRGSTKFTMQGIFCDEMDDSGPDGIASVINNRVSSSVPAYLSINLNVIDAGLAPGVSEPHVGGWTTKELVRVLRGIEGLNAVGAEVVGLAPMYDGEGEQTALFAAQVVYEILTSIVKRGVAERAKKQA